MRLNRGQIALLVLLIVVTQAYPFVIGRVFPVTVTPAEKSVVPPPWLFATVWPFLYLLLALALWWQIVGRGGSATARWISVGLFALQIIANFVWVPLYTRINRRAATYMLVFMLMLSVTGAVLASANTIVTPALMAPYIVWIAFALILSVNILGLSAPATTDDKKEVVVV